MRRNDLIPNCHTFHMEQFNITLREYDLLQSQNQIDFQKRFFEVIFNSVCKHIYESDCNTVEIFMLLAIILENIPQ